MLLLLAFGHAAEPGPTLPALPSGAPGVPVAIIVPWSEAPFVPARVEQAAFGPDKLAIGPDGAWAVVAPDGVIGSHGRLVVGPVDALGFTPSGDLLLLQGRTLRRVGVGGVTTDWEVPALVPGGVRLVVIAGAVYGTDVFGNLHPVAAVPDGGGFAPLESERLIEGPSVRRTADGDVFLDGERVARGALAARHVGEDCVIVEYGQRGSVSGRALVCGSDRWALPTEGLYRLVSGVAVTDGSAAWLDPREDGLHVVRVAR